MSSDRIKQPKASHPVNRLRRLSFKPWIKCNWHKCFRASFAVYQMVAHHFRSLSPALVKQGVCKVLLRWIHRMCDTCKYCACCGGQ